MHQARSNGGEGGGVQGPVLSTFIQANIIHIENLVLKEPHPTRLLTKIKHNERQ